MICQALGTLLTVLDAWTSSACLPDSLLKSAYSFHVEVTPSSC